jgi:hypothetical protein
MAKLPRALRISRELNAPPDPGPRVGNVMWEGVKESVWNPPTPHPDVRVTIGDDPHRAVHRDYTTKPATLAEQIEDLVNKSR